MISLSIAFNKEMDDDNGAGNIGSRDFRSAIGLFYFTFRMAVLRNCTSKSIGSFPRDPAG
jgi:hypothetical protein